MLAYNHLATQLINWSGSVFIFMGHFIQFGTATPSPKHFSNGLAQMCPSNVCKMEEKSL